jgi:hypothetical protein
VKTKSVPQSAHFNTRSWNSAIFGHPERKGEACAERFACFGLLDLATIFLAIPLARESLFDPLFFSRFQIEGMPLDLFNDVFLLHLPLEPAKGVFQRFALLEPDFSQ